jgi:hypothetical protein
MIFGKNTKEVQTKISKLIVFLCSTKMFKKAKEILLITVLSFLICGGAFQILKSLLIFFPAISKYFTKVSPNYD